MRSFHDKQLCSVEIGNAGSSPSLDQISMRESVPVFILRKTSVDEPLHSQVYGPEAKTRQKT